MIARLTDYILGGWRHYMKCDVCGRRFDRRSLDEVLIHLHDGPTLHTGITGKRIKARAEREVSGNG